MSNVKFNALASLALLAGAPVVAQAEMVEMAETELADVNGQGIIGASFGAVFGALVDPLVKSPTVVNQGSVKSFIDTNGNGILDPAEVPTATYNNAVTVSDNNYIPATIGDVAANGIGNGIGFGLLPFTGPITALGNFNGKTLENSASAGKQIADIAFAPIFKPIALAKQGVDTALNYAFFPISAPLNVAGNVFTNLNNSVVGTGTKILTAPINAVFGPINGVVNGVTGRAGATMDGFNFALTQTIGGVTTGVLGGISNATANAGLGITAAAFGYAAIANQQLTYQKMAAIGKPYNVTVTVPAIKIP